MIGQIERRDKYYMDLAFQVAKGSKCKRATYGSLILAADGKRIAGTGYNGKPAGSICDGVCFREGALPNDRTVRPCCLHSESNVLDFTAPTDRKGGTLYVTGVPCEGCALRIMQSGVARLVFFVGQNTHGHVGDSSEELWQEYGIPIQRIAFTYEGWERLYGEQGKC